MKLLRKILVLCPLIALFTYTFTVNAQPNTSEPRANLSWTKYPLNITNSLNFKRDDLTCISQKQAKFDITPNHAYVVTLAGKVVPSQVTQCFSESNDLGLAVSVALAAKETQMLEVYVYQNSGIATTFPAQTFAELQVRVGGEWQGDKLAQGSYIPVTHYTLPAGHEIGNKLFKYEGFGWESEQVAYRYYFDHRGSIDIFGKQENGLFLDEVGIDGDDYHALDHWGMDILKVGSSLGLGGIGAWQNNKLFGANNFSDFSVDINTGSLMSAINLNYQNWIVDDQKGDLAVTLTIAANSSLTGVKAQTSAGISHFATGIVKHDVELLHAKAQVGEWSYLATWGKQSLAKDDLGMAIFVKTDLLESFLNDQYNELTIFKSSTQPIYYFFSANWSQSPEGAKDKAQFIRYLEQTVALLNQPILVTSK